MKRGFKRGKKNKIWKEMIWKGGEEGKEKGVGWSWFHTGQVTMLPGAVCERAAAWDAHLWIQSAMIVAKQPPAA